ncbi:MAG: D-lactate dehydrogenase family protein [Polyangiaceae bacterium]
MVADDPRAVLAAHPLFGACRGAGSLATLSEACGVRTAPAGAVIFREGDPAPFVFVLVRGSCDVLKRGEDGHEVVLRSLAPTEVGGLTNLVGGAPRSATLRAREATTLLVVDKLVLLRVMRADEGLADAILSALGDKVRAKNAQVATLIEHTRRDTRESVAFFDAKPYEQAAFQRKLPETLRIKYIPVRLGPDTVRLADGYPIVCAFVNDDLGASVIEELAARGTRLIAMRCAGYNNVAIEAAAAANIPVVRVPAYSPHAVAEHTLALLLTLVRRTHRAYARVREGNFSLAGLEGFDLYGKTAGVVGTGKIGAIVANILVGFGMRVLAFDPSPSAALTALGVRYVALDELFASSDVVSLHVPLMRETYHLVDAARFAATKRGMVLLNTSRGGLVDAAALIDALKTGQVGAAGLDVYEEESDYFFQDRSDRVVLDDLLARLMTFPNVLITSHQGFLTREALDNIAETTLANIAEHLEGRALTNAVRR